MPVFLLSLLLDAKTDYYKEWIITTFPEQAVADSKAGHMSNDRGIIEKETMKHCLKCSTAYIEDFILLRWQSFPNLSINSIQSVSKFQLLFFFLHK